MPGAILSYAKMHHSNLPAGGPLDLRLNRHLVQGEEGTERMVGLVRSFVETGGNMMTLTVVDTEELRAAQREPEQLPLAARAHGRLVRLLYHAQPRAAGAPHPPPGGTP